MAPTDETLLSLLHSAKGGDQAAMERLLVLAHVHITRWCRTWFSRETDDVVQDIAQGALVRIALDLESCRAVTDAEFLAWCRAVARNAGLDFLRARKREWEVRTLFEDSGDESREESCAAPCRAGTQCLLDALESVLRQESDAVHALLWHRLVQHDTWAATAEAMGISRSGARRRFERTILRLRRGLKREIASLPLERSGLVSEFLSGRATQQNSLLARSRRDAARDDSYRTHPDDRDPFSPAGTRAHQHHA